MSSVLGVVSKSTTSCSNIGSHIDFYLKYEGRGVVIQQIEMILCPYLFKL